VTELRVVDLDSPDLTWGSHNIAGSEHPADIVMLGVNAEAGTRTCVVRFPAGWARPGTGNQPAGEEMVLLTGSLTISGLDVAVGQALVVEPFATRSATLSGEDTTAVVWFSGPGGGWSDGEAQTPGSAQVLAADAGLHRGHVDGLVGELVGRASVAGETFAVDIEVLWPAARTWAYVPAGVPVPEVDGLAFVHTFG
jgi:hypothetical protein